MGPSAVLCFLHCMLNRRKLVLFVVLLPGLLVAEQIHLKEGSVLEGTILQQSRTSIQIRTVDGVKTISKDDIRRIDYGKEAKAEQQRKEAERIKEAEKQKEAERAKERERQEELKRETEAKAEEKRAEEQEQRQKLEEAKKTQPVRPEESRLWWIEPTFSTGRGEYRSHLETVYRRYQTGLQILYRDDVYGTYSPEARWNYADGSHRNISLRAGWQDWIIELESKRHRASADFVQYLSTQPHIAGSDTVFDDLFFARVDGIQELSSTARAGYLFYKGKGLNLTAYLGVRTLAGDATFHYAGQSRSLYPDGSEAFDTYLPVPSTISLYGEGPEATFEATRVLGRITISVRVSIFSHDVRSSILEAFIRNDSVSNTFLATGRKDQFTLNGFDFSLRLSYKSVFDIELFLSYSMSRSRGELKKVREIFSLFYSEAFDEWSTFPLDRALISKDLSANVDRYFSGGSDQTIHAGISRRFWF